ncbi:hypothetical protein BJ741DRAFT_655293 [Chytriomyces cf. hyalinus JEL632]|nr:hypothetical protein BJ741DRAFT_655293 [Chytriomyces cf. hyalinus JEL632]
MLIQVLSLVAATKLASATAVAPNPIFQFGTLPYDPTNSQVLFYMDISKCGPQLPATNSSSSLLPINMIQSPGSTGGDPAGIEFQFNNYGQHICFPQCPPIASADEFTAFMATFNPTVKQVNGVCTVVLPWDLDNSLVANCFAKSQNKLSGPTRFLAQKDKLRASGSYNLEFEFTGDALTTSAKATNVVGAITAGFTVNNLDYNSDGAGTLKFQIDATMDTNSPADAEVRYVTGLDNAPTSANIPKLAKVDASGFSYSTKVTCIPSENPNQVSSYSYLGTARSCIKASAKNGDTAADCDKRVPQQFQITFSLDSTCKVSYKIKNNIVTAAVTDPSSANPSTKLFAQSTWNLSLKSDFLKAAGFRIETLGLTISTGGKTATVDPTCLPVMVKSAQTEAGNTLLAFAANPLDKAATFPTTINCANGKMDAFILATVTDYTFGVNMRFMDAKSLRGYKRDGNSSNVPETGAVTFTATVDGVSNLASAGSSMSVGGAAAALFAGLMALAA